MAISTVLSVISSILLVALLFCQVSGISITPDIDPPREGGYLQPGDKVLLTCSTNKAGAKPVWYWTDATDNATYEVLLLPGSLKHLQPLISATGSPTGGIAISININGKVGGNYTCSDGSESATYFVNVLDADSLIPRSVLTNGTDEKVVLRCDQRFAEPFPLIWTTFVNGSELILNLAPKEDKNYTVGDASNGYALTIRNKDRKRYPQKTGDYSCRLDLSRLDVSGGKTRTEREPILKKVVYEDKPDVRIEGSSAARTKSATKDEALNLTCVYNSREEGTYAVWNRVVNGSDQPIFDGRDYEKAAVCSGFVGTNVTKKCRNDLVVILQNKNESAGQFEKALILEFASIKDEDRGSYSCVVTESINGAQVRHNGAEVELKVKDKLAALWPFLGIVAEVVILCAIIFIYEKRRNKTVDEEDESEPMKGDVHETRDSVVRSRK